MYTVCIVGRPNVGKSTLFNRLTGKRQALVHRRAGTTRDYLEKIITIANVPVRLVDVAGWIPENLLDLSLEKNIYQQLTRIITESDLVIFLVDGRQGLHPQDKEVASFLRKLNKPVIVGVNKIDDIKMSEMVNDFWELGNWEYLAISGETGLNTDVLLEKIAQRAKKDQKKFSPLDSGEKPVTVAIVGRPNSGKSTLFNTILQEKRAIVSEIPGTTRDPIDAWLEYQNKKFIFIDTPGARRKYRDELEYLVDLKARKTIRRADIVILLLDVSIGITSLDCQLAEIIADNAKGAIVAVNKIDLLNKHKYPPLNLEKLRFLVWAEIVKISGKDAIGIERLLNTLVKVSEYYQKTFPDRTIKKFFQQFPEISFARQTGTSPPKFALGTVTTQKLSLSRIRHIQKLFRQQFSVSGVPVVFKFYYRKKQ